VLVPDVLDGAAHTVLLSVLNGGLSASIDGQNKLTATDPSPLTSGIVSIHAGENAIGIDQIGVCGVR
jgi:hypothetical protein